MQRDFCPCQQKEYPLVFQNLYTKIIFVSTLKAVNHPANSSGLQ